MIDLYCAKQRYRWGQHLIDLHLDCRQQTTGFILQIPYQPLNYRWRDLGVHSRGQRCYDGAPTSASVTVGANVEAAVGQNLRRCYGTDGNYDLASCLSDLTVSAGESSDPSGYTLQMGSHYVYTPGKMFTSILFSLLLEANAVPFN